ncbi:MAG: DUF1109 domain-containing protein [Steroidobacteraceae bacterium]
MKTEALIQSLAATVKPVSRHAVGQRIALGLVGGAVVTMLLIVAVLGLRPDLGAAMRGFPLWMKWLYTASLGIVAVAATSNLARPEGKSLRQLWLLAVPILLLAGIGIAELAYAPEGETLAMWLGGSWQVCPWIVLVLSLPIFLGLLWSYRRFAPTRLRAAGATAGLSAGAWAATLYCMHCPEVSAMFVLTWYSLGIGLATLLGALVGPRLLRW